MISLFLKTFFTKYLLLWRIGHVYPFFLIPNSIFSRLILSPIRTKYGFLMYVNPTDSVVSKNITDQGSWADTEARVFETQIKSGDVVVDIGANIGYFTLLAAQLVGKTGRVYAFEPDFDNFQILKKNVSLNRLTNVVLIHSAVGDQSGQINLYLNQKNKGDHRTFASAAEPRHSVQIPLISIDDYFNQHQSTINFIKMDIQGFESKAFHGMQQTLLKNPTLQLLFEFWPYGLRLAGSKPKNILTFLSKLTFSLFNVNEYEHQLTPVVEKDFDSYIRKLKPGKMSTNILAWRKPPVVE